MLLIQNICLQWGKEERGAHGEKVRSRFLQAYPLELQEVQGDVFIQNLNFYQNQSTILDAIQEEQYLSEKYHMYWIGLGQTSEQIRRDMCGRIANIKRHQCGYYAAIQDINLANAAICYREDRIELTFFYDEHRSGAPFRRGHNKDYQDQDSPFYRRDVLNETAFALTCGQYGRILWNERRTDYDNGTWYYQLHIYNLYYLQSENIPCDIFTRKEPDEQYRQLAVLY